MRKIFKNNKRRKQTNIKFSYYKKYRNIKEIIEKRYSVLIMIIIFLNIIIIGNLFVIQIIRQEHYENRVKLLNQNIVLGPSSPRGRIYDRHHRLIVDNKPIKIIYYKKVNDITRDEELKMAYEVAEILDVDYSDLAVRNLKEFWLRNNREIGLTKITDEEWKQLDERRLTLDDIEELKLERITQEELNEYKELDREAAYIYYLMNKGYYYSEKVIKKENITDHEYAKISENIHKLRGFNTRLDWERVYPYGDTFRTILGSVSTSESGLPYELKDFYLAKGYSLDDRVGISYLEYQYEDYLKGEKNTYELLSDGTSKLIKEGQRGNDIVITIDIELQKAIDKILEQELMAAKKEPNTEYYNRSFVVVTDPHTGEIIAMSAKQIVQIDDKYEIYDYTPGIINSSVVMGSVVKGASNIVGFNQGVLKVGEIRDDYCIKIAATPTKCSWRYLGRIDDVGALKYSSNSYQYQTAIKVGKGVYKYDEALSIDPKTFDIYRNTFAEFGLGVKTQIDLPNEGLGYKGNSELSGHLLDFSIGQYDTYTPIQLSQYIGTIANGGYRIAPHLLKSVYSPTKEGLTSIVYNREPEVLNKLNAKDEHLKRIQEGFKKVTENGGTGVGYMPPAMKPAGKTGTSESFIDSDLDGVVDLETYSHTFAGFAPYDNPKVAFTVISPDISPVVAKSGYRSTVNRRISFEVSKKIFEIYK